MKHSEAELFSKNYHNALRRCMRGKATKSLRAAERIGSTALALGLEILDIARIHEQALQAFLDKGSKKVHSNPLVKRAEKFFLVVISPIEQTHRVNIEKQKQIIEFQERLQTLLSDLDNLEKSLKQANVRRESVEVKLETSIHHYDTLLAQSCLMQEQMRALARLVLSAQEDERKRISRELHDEVAQTLAGINVLLSSFEEAAAINALGFSRKIAATQRLVDKSMTSISRFARSLRPAILDDLGLIPALRSFMKTMPGRKGVSIQLIAFVGVESMDIMKRTVLYRVAQEALTNVFRHSGATSVTVKIKKVPHAIRMEVIDDGKAFNPAQVLSSGTNKHLGLIGMRERIEMVGGTFTIDSIAGKGTTIRADIPFNPCEAES